MQSKPYVVVLGNEKGGTGKSTVAMHIIVGLLYRHLKVGSIDIDARQGTLTRYVENRKDRVAHTQEDLPLSVHHAIFRSRLNDVNQAEEEDKQNLLTAFDLLSDCDVIVVDTPGSDLYLSRLAHSFADTLLTPLNDSLIDLDVLVRVEGDDKNTLKPSIYAEMVWEQKKQKAQRANASIDWIVLRNRLSSLYSNNKQEMHRILTALSKRIGYRLAEGFGERVIFREMFLSGKTLWDIAQHDKEQLTLSHVAAKQEIQTLLKFINFPDFLKQKVA